MREWPCELVPGVLDALAWRVGDLAACCRVSRVWGAWATPRLYERLWLRDHLRVIRVFRTLADAPHLARMVRILGRWGARSRRAPRIPVWTAGRAA